MEIGIGLTGIIMEKEGERNSKIAVGELRMFCDLFVSLLVLMRMERLNDK